MNSKYWLEKNVLITGINGFIGGNLAKALLNQGANVFGLIRNDDRKSQIYYEGLNNKITLIRGDLTDKELLTTIISEEMIQSVFHLAAQVEVGVGLANPYLTFETNTRGTYSLMEAIRIGGKNIESVIVASTDKSYGSYPVESMPYKEDYPLKPQYPYEVSKACADMIAQSYASEIYKIPVVVTRFCNIYGPGQLNFSAIVPDCIRSALGYSHFIPRGNGLQVRDFIFAEDVVDLYLKMGEALAKDPSKYAGRVYNAGTNTPTEVREVVKQIFKSLNQEKEYQRILNDMRNKETVGEISVQYMSYDLVHQEFGWKPSTSLEDGILKTIDWFKGYFEWKFEKHDKR